VSKLLKEGLISSIEKIVELDQWIRQLRKDVPLSETISVVSQRLWTAGEDEHYALALNLNWLLHEAERYDAALQLLEDLIDRYPDDVRFPINKATLEFYFLDDAEEALSSIDFALRRAYRTGFSRREALGVKARILLKLGRGADLSQVLDEIMSMQMIKGVPDIGRERDFVDRAPPGLISEDVLARYNKFRPKRLGDGTADEPPEWEPPEWE
jgi:tetratricopeptide (TPR) repeat protein